MATTKRKKREPLRNPGNQMNELISLAMDVTRERLLNGTASSQMITQLLRQQELEYQLKLKKLETDVKVGNAKVKQIEDGEDIKRLYQEAMAAMKDYQGSGEDWDEEYNEYA